MSNTDDILDKYVGQMDAAKILGLSIARISALCRESRFENAVKIGGAWLIPKVALEHYTRRKPGRKKNLDRTILENAIKESEKWKNITNK